MKLKALLGHRQVQEWTPVMIENAYRRPHKDGLAPKTILNTHTALRKVLTDAEQSTWTGNS